MTRRDLPRLSARPGRVATSHGSFVVTLSLSRSGDPAEEDVVLSVELSESEHGGLATADVCTGEGTPVVEERVFRLANGRSWEIAEPKEVAQLLDWLEAYFRAGSEPLRDFLLTGDRRG